MPKKKLFPDAGLRNDQFTMECRGYRSARQSDMQRLRAELGEGAWSQLARLLESVCTKPEWILLGFETGKVTHALALAAPSQVNLPLEIFWLHGGLDTGIDSLRLFQQAIENAKAFGARELYCTVPQDSVEASVLSQAGFCRWRKVVRFESAGPVDLGVRGYRSEEAGHFARGEIIALIEKTSERCPDSQIEFYRQRFGGWADAEMTLKMMESTRYHPGWWRVALTPQGNAIGIIFPVVAFGEPTVGFVGIVPEYRGRSIASFLFLEAWSVMKGQGFSTLCAETDERSSSMHRALTKSRFSRRFQKEEWRMELSTRNVSTAKA